MPRRITLALDGKATPDVERLLAKLQARAEFEGWTLDIRKGTTCPTHGVALSCPSCVSAARGRANKGRPLSPEALEQRRAAARRPRPGRRKTAEA